MLSNTINTRTYVRLLRHLGIALIFAPEPFTTPFGVACILAARHLSKQHEANVNNRLQDMVRYYLAHSALPSHDADGKSGASGQLKRHGLSAERPILGQITGSRSFEAKPSVRKGRQGVRESRASHTTDMQSRSPNCKYGAGLSDTFTRTQKVMHHTMDTEWLSQRYESASAALAHSSWATTSGCGEGATHHSVNMGLLSQRYGTGSVGQVNARAHRIGITQLRQRYGSAETSTMVHKALQNNNYYYDTLSRRNFIEGY